MPNLYIHALGCKTNHYENQALAQQLNKEGFRLVETIEEADVGILNTCTVTAEAGRKSRQFLRRMKTRNPNILVVAMGCYAQLEDLSDVSDLAIGTADRNAVLQLITKHLNRSDSEESRDFEIELEHDLLPLGKASTETEYEELGIVGQQIDTRAQIKIQDGCNSFCTYCAIPLARGRIRSRLRENIIKEAELLAENGHKEVVLTGIHICSFEKEYGRNSDALAELCVELNQISGLNRIRLGSLEPLSITESFLEILKKADKVCPHFHLSLQSGSDTVLQRMHRQYTAREYVARVEMLRSIYENPAITTDVMVGFPEETEQEFRESLEFVKHIQFSRIHVFPYSVRPGTKAASMRQVESRIVKRRVAQMLDLGEELAAAYARTCVGMKDSFIVEESIGKIASGYTSRYVKVLTETEHAEPGEEIEVFIKDSEKDNLIGIEYGKI